MTLDEHIEFFTELKQYMEFFAALEDSQLVANVEYKLAEAEVTFEFSYEAKQKKFYYMLDVRIGNSRFFVEAINTNRLFALQLVIADALDKLIKNKAQQF